jgi:hypothetical protein
MLGGRSQQMVISTSLTNLCLLHNLPTLAILRDGLIVLVHVNVLVSTFGNRLTNLALKHDETFLSYEDVKKPTKCCHYQKSS